jgi:hypothetical protein
MPTIDLETVYEQAATLKSKEKLTLISKLALDLRSPKKTEKHKLSELQGLGKEIWQKTDVEKYLADLRGEWNER